MMIVAIDPGTTHSALVTTLSGPQIHSGMTASAPEVQDATICENEEAVEFVRTHRLLDGAFQPNVLAVEMIDSYGMPVGRSVFETCVWIGRFVQAWGGRYVLIPRRKVKLELCGSARAKDANVRQAVIDLYPATGGGKVPQVGTKAEPGPLYGIKKDLWQALALAITAQRQLKHGTYQAQPQTAD